jgi:hypothetical protein
VVRALTMGGGLALQLSEEEVLRWFQNMDFEVPHTRVPVDGYDPSHGAGPQLPDVSFVQYNYSMHIVEVDRTVVKTILRALDLYKYVALTWQRLRVAPHLSCVLTASATRRVDRRPVDPTRPHAEVPDPENPGATTKAPMQVDVTQMDALLHSLLQVRRAPPKDLGVGFGSRGSSEGEEGRPPRRLGFLELRKE